METQNSAVTYSPQPGGLRKSFLSSTCSQPWDTELRKKTTISPSAQGAACSQRIHIQLKDEFASAEFGYLDMHFQVDWNEGQIFLRGLLCFTAKNCMQKVRPG